MYTINCFKHPTTLTLGEFHISWWISHLLVNFTSHGDFLISWWISHLMVNLSSHGEFLISWWISHGSYLSKRGSDIHAPVAGDVCLTFRLVRVISCSLHAPFHIGEKIVVSCEHRHALRLLWLFSPVRYRAVTVAIKGSNSFTVCVA